MKGWKAVLSQTLCLRILQALTFDGSYTAWLPDIATLVLLMDSRRSRCTFGPMDETGMGHFGDAVSAMDVSAINRL